MFKLNTKFDADSLLYSLSHFEYDGHTVHMLTQWCLPPPLTNNSEIIIVHPRTFQSTLLGCQVTSMSHKPFLLFNFFWADFIYDMKEDQKKKKGIIFWKVGPS